MYDRLFKRNELVLTDAYKAYLETYGNPVMAKSAVPKEEEKPKKFNYSSTYLAKAMKERLIDQDEAVDKIVPYITLFGSGMNDPSKPVGSFLLLGNTGVGKTKTVEVLAEILHGNSASMVKIDCGEFQHSHEVSKLIGSPPGYLGHRETQPLLTQQKLDSVTSGCPISILLLDEIEKAHYALNNILLSVLDKATLRLGDNSSINLSKTLVFFTSNLSSRKITDLLNPNMGYSGGGKKVIDSKALIEKLGTAAVMKHFSPEFVNRIDEVITYSPLSKEAVKEIFNIAIKKIKNRFIEKLAEKDIFLVLTEETKDLIIEEGFSELYGARQLNRVLQKRLVNPLANLLVETEIPDSSIIKALVRDKKVVFQILQLKGSEETI